MSTSYQSIVSRSSEQVVRWIQTKRAVLVRAFAVLVALIAWELYATTQPPYLFPQLGTIIEAFVTQVNEYGLFSAYATTLTTVFIGYTIAVITGVVVGLAMGIDKRVEVTLDPYISAMYVAPISALVPVIILLFGPTFHGRVLVVFLFVVFDMIVTTSNGAKTTPEGLIAAVRSMGASRLSTVRKVILPHSLPYIFSGLRLGIGRAIKGVILAELLIEFSNLGAIIQEWVQLFQIAGALSITLLLMVTGIGLTRGVKVVRDRVIYWEAAAEVSSA